MIPSITRTRRPPVFPGTHAGVTTYWPPAAVAITSATGAVTANKISYQPALYPGLTIDRLRVEVTTGVAGSGRLGIYANNNGNPGTLIVQGSAVVDVTNIANVDASFTAVTLPNDWVWFAFCSDVGPTMRIGAMAVFGSIVGIQDLSTPRRGLIADFTFASLPATADLTNIGFGGNLPIIAAWKS